MSFRIFRRLILIISVLTSLCLYVFLLLGEENINNFYLIVNIPIIVFIIFTALTYIPTIKKLSFHRMLNRKSILEKYFNANSNAYVFVDDSYRVIGHNNLFYAFISGMFGHNPEFNDSIFSQNYGLLVDEFKVGLDEVSKQKSKIDREWDYTTITANRSFKLTYIPIDLNDMTIKSTVIIFDEITEEKLEKAKLISQRNEIKLLRNFTEEIVKLSNQEEISNLITKIISEITQNSAILVARIRTDLRNWEIVSFEPEGAFREELINQIIVDSQLDEAVFENDLLVDRISDGKLKRIFNINEIFNFKSNPDISFNISNKYGIKNIFANAIIVDNKVWGALFIFGTSKDYSEFGMEMIAQLSGGALSRFLKSQNENQSLYQIKSLLDDTQQIVFEIDKSANIMFANQVFFSKFKDSQFLQELEIFNYFNKNLTKTRISELFNISTSTINEIRFKAKDQPEIWLLAQVLPKLDINGTASLLFICTDISDLKKAKDKVFRNFNELNDIFSNLPQAIFMVDQDSRILNLNSKARDIGIKLFKRESTKNELFYNLIPAEELTTFSYCISKALIGEFSSIEKKLDLADNSESWYLIEFSPVMHDSNSIKMVLISLTDISERKKSEDLLKETAEKNKMFVNLAPDPILILDGLGTIIEINVAALNLFDYNKFEITGKKISDYIRNEFINEHSDFLKKLSFDKVSNIAIKFLNKSQNIIDCEISAKILGHGRIMYILRNLSSRNADESDVYIGDKIYEIAYNENNKPTIIIDDSGSVIYSNPAFNKLRGINIETYLNIFDDTFFLATNLNDCIKKCFIQAKTIKSEPFRVQRNYTEEKKRDLTFEAIITPLPVNSMHQNKAMVLFEDITDFIELNNKLSENKNKFNFIVNNTSSLAVFFDNNLNILYSTVSFDLIAGTMTNLKNVFDESSINSIISKIQQLEISNLEKTKVEIESLNANKHIRTFEMTIFKQEESNSSPTYKSILIDITERKKIFAELEKVNDAIRHNEFFQNIVVPKATHVLRSSINGIIGAASILSSNEQVEKIKYFTDSIILNGNYIINSFEKVIDYNNIEKNIKEKDFTPTSIKQFVSDFFDDQKVSLDAKNINCTITLQNDSIEILANKEMLVRAMKYLTVNQYFMDKMTDLKINISSSIIDYKVILQIEISIQPDDIYKTFIKELQNTNTARVDDFNHYSFDYLIATRILKAINGTTELIIAFEPLIKVKLPVLNISKEGQSLVLSNTEHKKFVDNSTRSNKILIVEDNELNQNLFNIFLSSHYPIDCVSTSKEAINLVKTKQFDLILMNIELGDKQSGFKLVEVIKSIPEYEKIPVIAVTGYTQTTAGFDFTSRGFASILTKPFSEEKLLKAIEVAINLDKL